MQVNKTLNSRHSYTLCSNRKLHYSWEYRRFFNQSQVFRLSECIVFRIQNDLNHFRLGITLKARGTSVNRNRVKRQIREAIRLQTEILGSFDYNIVIPASKKLDYLFSLRLRECLQKQLPHALKNH